MDADFPMRCKNENPAVMRRPAGCGDAKKCFAENDGDNPAAEKFGAENALCIFTPFAGMIRIRFNGYDLSPFVGHPGAVS